MRKLVILHSANDVISTLRAEMKASSKTQKQLAEHMGMTEKHISFMLTKKNNMNINHLLTICAFLDVGIAFYPNGES